MYLMKGSISGPQDCFSVHAAFSTCNIFMVASHPLFILQVTTLVNHPKKKGSKLGKSKNAHKLAQDIEDATIRLIKTGEDIAQEFPEIREEMLAACKDCRGAGTNKNMIYFWSEKTLFIITFWLFALH